MPKKTTREILEAKSTEDLDEAVHDMKGEEAAAINNSGREEQIQYLIDSGWEEE